MKVRVAATTRVVSRPPTHGTSPDRVLRTPDRGISWVVAHNSPYRQATTSWFGLPLNHRDPGIAHDMLPYIPKGVSGPPGNDREHMCHLLGALFVLRMAKP